MGTSSCHPRRNFPYSSGSLRRPWPRAHEIPQANEIPRRKLPPAFSAFSRHEPAAGDAPDAGLRTGRFHAGERQPVSVGVVPRRIRDADAHVDAHGHGDVDANAGADVDAGATPSAAFDFTDRDRRVSVRERSRWRTDLATHRVPTPGPDRHYFTLRPRAIAAWREAAARPSIARASRSRLIP